VNTGPLSLNDRLQMAVIGRLKFDFQWANHWHYSNPNSSEWNGMGAVNHCAWAVAALTVGYVYLSICPGQALGCPGRRFQYSSLVILGRLLECLDISRKCQKYKAAKASSNNAVVLLGSGIGCWWHQNSPRTHH